MTAREAAVNVGEPDEASIYRGPVVTIILGRPSSDWCGDFVATIMQEIGYELQVVAACQHSDMLVDQLLKLLREGPHGAVLDGGAAMVTPEAMLSY